MFNQTWSLWGILPPVNYYLVLIGAVLSFIVGSIIYSPKVLGNIWMNAQPRRPKSDYNNPTIPMILEFFGTAILAYLVVVFITNYFLSPFATFIIIGLFLTFKNISNVLFLGNKYLVGLITAFYDLTKLLILVLLANYLT